MNKFLTLILLVINFFTQAQQLITDTSFGNNGQIFSPAIGNSIVTKILQQSDDKILMCGNSYDFNCNCYYNDMFRTDCSGMIDSSFGINGFVHHTFDQRNLGVDYVLLGDGKILVSGVQSESNAGSQQFPFIARYHSDGSVDSTFGVNGTKKINYLGPGIFSNIYLLDSGKILCTGSPNFGSNLMMRFDSSGAVDPSFGSGGFVQHPIPPGVTFFYDFKSIMRSDGKIVSASPAYLGIANDKNVVISCFDTSGVLDSTFGSNGFYIDYNFATGTELRMILQSDDKLIVAQQNISETGIIIARYTLNGGIDSTFGLNGYINIPAPGGRLKYLSLFDDNKILVGYTNGPAIFQKFDNNGTPDANFSLNGGNSFQFSNSDLALTAIVNENNEILMGGSGSAFSLTSFNVGSTSPVITQNGDVLNANVNNSGASYQWLLNGNPLSDSAKDSISVTQNGTYRVVVTNAWGCEQSDDFEVTSIPSGFHESIADLLRVYPNPAKDWLHISWNKISKNTTLELIDLTGKVLFKGHYNAISTTVINLQQFAKGMYMLRVQDAANSFTRRLVIE